MAVLIAALAGAGLAAAGAPALAASGSGSALLRSRPGMAPGALATGPAVPKPGVRSELAGVFCTSRSSCWGVGSYGATAGDRVDEILRWNGRTWSKAHAPHPGFTSTLTSVRCTSPSACWAAGYADFGNHTLNQVLRWNGRTWSQVGVPSPGGTIGGHSSVLFDISCPSAASCWAAGEYGYVDPGSKEFSAQALHWNGRTWSRVRIPQPAGTASNDVNLLRAIRCATPASCWGVGSYGTVSGAGAFVNEILHWNGTRWSRVSAPNPGGSSQGGFNQLADVSCTSAGSCWAVGNYGGTGPPMTVLNQVLHWNGRTWSSVAVPDPDSTGPGASNMLTGSTCSSKNNCWAVGQFGTSSGTSGAIFNQALHWNGSTWAETPTPDPGGSAGGDFSSLSGIRCASSASCWAVGAEHQQPSLLDVNQVLHWNGARWSAR